jgi:recombination protein RecA
MARPKKADKVEEVVENKIKKSCFDLVRAQVEKSFGKNILKSGDAVLDEKTIIIPLSPALDIGLGGGIPEGTWGIFTGPPKLGKTTTMLSFAANAQKPEFGGRNVYYFKVEGRLSKKNLEIAGLDMSKLQIIESTEEKILTAEDILQIAEIAIMTDPGCVIIIDSYSSLCTNSEMSNEIKSNSRSDAPKLLYNFTRKMGQVVPLKKCIVIGVMKIIANTSGYGASEMEQGGGALKFQEDWKIRCIRKELCHLNDDKTQTATGQIVTWRILNSVLGAPGAEVTSHIKYGIGVDSVREICDIAIDMNIIVKGGSWFNILPEENEDKLKFQGMADLMEYIESNPDVFEQINTRVRNMLYA